MHKLLFLLFLILGVASNCFSAQIVLVADAWPPYNNDSGDVDRGYIVDITEKIFSMHGHEVVYKIIPWKVAIEEARKGTYDGLIGADTEEGAGFVFPQEPAGSFQVAFFVKKGNPWRFTNTRSLEKVKLGVAEGYAYNKWLSHYIETNKKDFNRVQSVSGDFPLIANINKLMAEHIDVVTAASSTMNYAAKKNGVHDQIQYAGSGGQGSSVFLVFSPARESSRLYANMFDEGIRKLRVSGELARILERYGLTDWK